MDVILRSVLCIACLAAVSVLTCATAGAAKGPDQPDPNRVCVTINNHWSYIGIGWQLGIESCVLSAEDAMHIADLSGAKTGLNLDAHAYEYMAEKFPEVAKRLAKYVKEGKVELIGGSFGQPMGTTVSGESNIRQLVMGREAIKKSLGIDVATFLEEEEFSHPQLPQLLVESEFKYASMAQMDTWGRAGMPEFQFNVLNWKGKDGSVIRSTPKNILTRFSSDVKAAAATPECAQLRALGQPPLVMRWEEFGWESEEQPAYLWAGPYYTQLAIEIPVEYVTLEQYMDRYGRNPKETVSPDMDAWNKSLTWGLGGDQVRVLDRKTENVLLAAECFDAIASTMGGKAHPKEMESAWKHLLASQSHDVGLCEYSRWQGDRFEPLDRVQDYHNFSWGTIGYNHLESAMETGKPVLDASLQRIASQVGTKAMGDLAITVFNPSGWERTETVSTGRLYPIPANVKDIAIKDSAGKAVPSQITTCERDEAGNLVVATVSFTASKIPSVGYATYYLKYSNKPAAASTSVLKYDETALTMENDYVKVKLDPKSGAIASLIDKKTGKEMLKTPYPIFTGTSDPGYPLRPGTKEGFDSATSQGTIDWIDKGPVLATVRARHSWPYLIYESRVTLAADSPYVEVTTRVLAQAPPQRDDSPPDIKRGYYISFTPATKPEHVIRDYPLAIEESKNPVFQGLTFVDLANADGGLMILHPGTQYFRFDDDGRLRNLLVREWESYYSGEWGWPRYCEYHHALYPHDGTFTNADRARSSSAFCDPLICVVGKPGKGDLPARKGFITVSPASVQLSAFRKTTGAGYELRVVEVEGRDAKAQVKIDLPITKVTRTDLMGKKLADVSSSKGAFTYATAPWKIVTFGLK